MKLNGYLALKKILLFVLLPNGMIGVRAQSNTIKTDILRPIGGRYMLAYARATKAGFAFQFGIETGRYGRGTINGQTDYLLKGTSVVPELRYYPFFKRKNSSSGFFIGETFRLSYYKEQYNALSSGGVYKLSVNSNVRSFGLDIGYKFDYGNFCMEFVVGQELIGKAKYDELRMYIPTAYSDQLSKGEDKYYQFRILLGYIFSKRKAIEN